MCIQNSYSPEVLNNMEGAFKAVWDTLYAHIPVKGESSHELGQAEPHSRQLSVGWPHGPCRTAPQELETMALNPR